MISNHLFSDFSDFAYFGDLNSLFICLKLRRSKSDHVNETCHQNPSFTTTF